MAVTDLHKLSDEDARWISTLAEALTSCKEQKGDISPAQKGTLRLASWNQYMKNHFHIPSDV